LSQEHCPIPDGVGQVNLLTGNDSAGAASKSWLLFALLNGRIVEIFM
jgi:hypothetical protein